MGKTQTEKGGRILSFFGLGFFNVNRSVSMNTPIIRKSIIHHLAENDINSRKETSLDRVYPKWKSIVVHYIMENQNDFSIQHIIQDLQNKNVLSSCAPIPVLEILIFAEEVTKEDLNYLEMKVLEQTLKEKETVNHA